MKIGIFGGCFNPPHKMHQKIAESLVGMQVVDKVIFTPTGNFYEKRGLIDGNFRLEMLKMMTRDACNIEVSNYELENKSYTYQTLDYFKKKYPEDEIFFILGADNLREFPTWQNPDYILDHYGLIVINRDEDIESLVGAYQKRGKKVFLARVEREVMSSTEIRDLLAHQRLEVARKMLDEDVLLYIRKNHLYEGK